MTKFIGQLAMSLPMYYLLNEGCRHNGIHNPVATIALSVLVVMIYRAGDRE